MGKSKATLPDRRVIQTKGLSHFFLAAPAGTIILAKTSLSFCKTINLASSINLPSGAEPGTALCATCAATTTAGPGSFAPRALFLRCPIPDPQTTTHSSTFPCGGIVDPEQTLACEAISACRLIVTSASIVAEEWMCAPGRMVDCGPMVTK